MIVTDPTHTKINFNWTVLKIFSNSWGIKMFNCPPHDLSGGREKI